MSQVIARKYCRFCHEAPVNGELDEATGLCPACWTHQRRIAAQQGHESGLPAGLARLSVAVSGQAPSQNPVEARLMPALALYRENSRLSAWHALNEAYALPDRPSERLAAAYERLRATVLEAVEPRSELGPFCGHPVHTAEENYGRRYMEALMREAVV